MNNIKFLKHWHNDTSTEVRVGDWVVDYSTFTNKPSDTPGVSHIIEFIDTERLEIGLKLNRVDGGTVVIKHYELTPDYGFFLKI